MKVTALNVYSVLLGLAGLTMTVGMVWLGVVNQDVSYSGIAGMAFTGVVCAITAILNVRFKSVPMSILVAFNIASAVFFCFIVLLTFAVIDFSLGH